MTQLMMKQSQFLTELQTKGLRLKSADQVHVSRRGGAGPSDHQAITVDGTTLMVPIYTQTAWASPFSLSDDVQNEDVQKQGATLLSNNIPLADVTFAKDPEFYNLTTADGIPYSHIATLHSTDVLATTVLQTCIRYESRRKACQFCSIGQSLRAGRTIAHKTPEQLAEVAKAAVELDGIKHIVMTTGTPAGADRGAKVMCESAQGIKAVVDVPIQGQCEPPKDPVWYQRMKDAGIDALGMHLEVITPELRKAITPGKSEVSLDEYYQAFEDAVAVFGRGQVSTYILAGLGDTEKTIIDTCQKLIGMGVYPFVVPFVPISGTPLEDRPAPTSEFMEAVLRPLAQELVNLDMTSDKVKAGCVRCGACSSLSRFEKEAEDERQIA
ncbi:radical SAM protein [Marinomonas ushuaiensis DSM 15871]|uniref:Radical SAM protein n=1 Tax=Marinomonas ushuaiensis DSM 15871 TaxID=1122207 RepID=X7E3T2_9GAMM|nr:MSMEG_0568 family radical SAM protein [Marinomonas ushuaiensis]ETX09818.1 radical SAM protein [Marinomonas ushuaiensis DSM 15871]